MEEVQVNTRIPKYKPLFTTVLIVLICITFLIQSALTFITNDPQAVLIRLGAKWNEGIRYGEYYRFISCALLHGNIVHLLLNAVSLRAFGKELESIFGSTKFLLVFFMSVWAASLTSYIFSPYLAIGASGGVFGIIGALTVFFYKQKNKILGSDIKFKSMYTIAIVNIIFGLLMPHIDNSAHVGGLISGGIISFFISPDYYIDEKKLVVKQKNKQALELLSLLIFIIILFCISLISTKKLFL